MLDFIHLWAWKRLEHRNSCPYSVSYQIGNNTSENHSDRKNVLTCDISFFLQAHQWLSVCLHAHCKQQRRGGEAVQLLCSDTVSVCLYASVASELVIVRTHNSCSYFGDINVQKMKKDPRHSLQSIVVAIFFFFKSQVLLSCFLSTPVHTVYYIIYVV